MEAMLTCSAAPGRCAHHQEAFVGIDDPQPNGHVCVLTVLQEGPDCKVASLGVRLGNTNRRRKVKKLKHTHIL